MVDPDQCGMCLSDDINYHIKFFVGVTLACSQTLVSASGAFVVRIGSGSAVLDLCTCHHVLVRFPSEHPATKHLSFGAKYD